MTEVSDDTLRKMDLKTKAARRKLGEQNPVQADRRLQELENMIESLRGGE